jgi:hypothetical protein
MPRLLQFERIQAQAGKVTSKVKKVVSEFVGGHKQNN